MSFQAESVRGGVRLLLAAALAAAAIPASATAQKALVYCPAGIDVTGCGNVAAAVNGDFPDGVDRAYDGSAGTVDLKSVDLRSYAVLVVPSLADGSASSPYALLRDSAVQSRLRSALVGRVALWSGTPDQGSANRDVKDALIRSLARWAQGNYATGKGPGLVVLQDLSESVSARYGWVKGLTGLTITPDSAVNSYASVRAVTETGTTILSNGTGSQLAYANMASLGFYLPEGAAGVTLDAVGQTGTTQGGQVVLLTASASGGTATVATDRDDYAPETVVTITGRGFQPGETVNMVLREDPVVHEDRTLTAAADASGGFVNTSFSPEPHDVGARFLLTATGATSGMRAEATFTDATSINSNGVTVGPSTSTVVAGSSASYTVSVRFNGNGSCAVALSVSSVLPTGVTASFSPGALTGTGTSTLTSTLTVGTAAATPDGTTSFTVLVRGTGAAGANCTSSNTNVTGAASLTVSAPVATGVAAAAANTAYSPSAQTLSLSATVSPAVTAGTVTFTVRDGSSTTIGTAVTGSIGAGSSASASYTLPAGAASGTYTITAAYSGASGFASSSGTASLGVAKANQTTAVTVTGMPSAAQPYQATFTVSGSGGNGTGAYSFAATGACSVNATSGAAQMTSGTGTCSITAARGGDANYNASSPGSAATVAAALASQATLTVTGVPAGAQTFGSTFTVGATGGSGTGAVSFAATGACSVSATSGLVQISSGTGSCSLTASRAADNNYSSATSAAATVAAARANQVIAWADPAPITYGTTLAGVLNASVTTGDGALSYDRLATDILSAGTQTITATAAATTNYNLATRSVTLTVNRATPTVGATGGSFEYDGATHGATATATGIGGATLPAPTITYNGGSTLPTDAGSYAVLASFAGDANYESASATATITIGRRALGVAADDQTREYGDANPTLTGTLTGAVSGDNLTGSYSTTATTSSPAGDYAILAGVSDPGSRLANYNVTSTNGTLKVTRAPLTVTVADASRVYGSSNPSFTGALTGVKNSDPITASYATTATAASAVGGYDITASLADPGSRLGNYNVTLNKGTLTVTPAPLAVTVAGATKVYGSDNPAFTGSVVGIQNADAITASYSSAATAASDVGNYPITATLSDPDGRLGNYTVTSTAGTLTVTQKALGVKADDRSKVYGEVLPGFTASFSGFVLGQDATALAGTLAFTSTATAASHVGSYTITPSGLTSTNYAITFSDGVLGVTPAPLTVTADDRTRVYGAANPAFTVSVSGLVNGDMQSALTGTLVYGGTGAAAVANTNVGSDYTIEPSGLASDDYLITFVPGKLSITKAPVTLATNSKTRVYGDANPTFDGTLTGVVAGDNITAAYASLATPASAVGGYDITPTLVDPASRLANYDVTSSSGTLTITPAPLAVTANSTSKIQGDIVPVLTGTITGLRNADAITATYSTTATDMSPPGPYPITATLTDANPAKLGNYTVTYQSGTLTVTPNAAPVLGAVTAPTAPVQLGTSITASAIFTDVDPSASRNYPVSIDWGDGTASYTAQLGDPGTISSAHSYTAAGVYTVRISVADKVNTTPVSQMFQYVVVYDPNGGFVTGGGWINSPAGAYVRDPSLSGKATFGFVSKYQKGANTPSGNTQFQFHEGSFDFKSTAYDWLVIAGSRAQYKGSGVVNGAGSYSFMLTATDGRPDQFRIKITDRATGQLVYDNMIGASDTDPLAGSGTILGGGSIQVQSR